MQTGIGITKFHRAAVTKGYAVPPTIGSSMDRLVLVQLVYSQ